jgi:ABC-type multidrug transport system fused ATPase/permease subunit
LFKAWGINFESGLVVADQTHRFTDQDRVLTGVSSFNGEAALDTKDPVTAQLDNVFMILPGGFTGEPATGLHKSSLVRTTTNTQLFDGMRASGFDQKLLTSTPVTNTAYDMVVRLVGRFPTAFPDGRPGEAAPAEGEKKDKPEEKKTAALKEPTGEGAVVLFADVDMISDNGAFRPVMPQAPQFGMMLANGNFPLAANVLEQLTGDQNLIGARSRPSSRRPFKVLEDMQSRAEQRVSGEITAIQSKISETEQKLSEMAQAQSKDSGKLVITSAMQAEADKMTKDLNAANKRLRDIQKDLAREKDSLEAKLTWANILVMPLLVALVGMALALYRRSRTAAR